MAKAISHVKTLTLTVIHHEYVEDKGDEDNVGAIAALEGQPQQPEQPILLQPEVVPQDDDITPAVHDLGLVSGGVFAMLAAGVPNLRELKLRGCCWDAALSTFGLACPHLIKLDFEALNVPLEALESFGKDLPNLVFVSIMNRVVETSSRRKLGRYLDAFLPTTQQCLQLSRLEIEFKEGTKVACQPDTWALIPADLKHLRCGCYMEASPSFDALIRRVPSLSLEVPPCDTLQQIFHEFPILEKVEFLSTCGEAVYVICDGDPPQQDDNNNVDDGFFDYPFKLSDVKQRLLSGRFSLTCHSMSFTGSALEVRDVFQWLPTFSGVGMVEIVFEGNNAPPCMEHVVRLFPRVHQLILGGSFVGRGVWDIMEALGPLAALPKLGILTLRCPQLALTLDSLTQLCVSLPRLKVLIVAAEMCEGIVQADELASAIGMLGRDIAVRVVQ